MAFAIGDLPDAINLTVSHILHYSKAVLLDAGAASEDTDNLGVDTFAENLVGMAMSDGDLLVVPSDGWTQPVVCRAICFRPSVLIVLSVILFPLVTNVWISFKPVTLGDLRAPSIPVNERLMTDKVTATLGILAVDDHCALDGNALRRDLGGYEAGKRQVVIVRITATQAFLDAPINVKDTESVFDFVPENILTNHDVTLDNFSKAFNATDFWTVLRASMYYTMAGTVGALVMGLFAV